MEHQQLVLLADDACDDRIECPAIFKYGRGAVVRAKKLPQDLRAQLNIPDDEDAVFLPDGRLIVTAAQHPLMEQQ